MHRPSHRPRAKALPYAIGVGIWAASLLRACSSFALNALILLENHVALAEFIGPGTHSG